MTWKKIFLFLLVFNRGLSRGSKVCRPKSKDPQFRFKSSYVEVKNKTKPNSALTLEYAKYEVNITQTKLREQEVTIKDLRFKNSLLESRV